MAKTTAKTARGKWYLFKPLTATQKEQKCEQYKGDRAFKARVAKEYQRFYLLETENYMMTMLKSALGIEWRRKNYDQI